MDDATALLLELEPEAGRLYDRHARVAQEWFPHEYIPYRLGRDFDTEPWTPDQPRLTGVAQTAFEVGLLTEDNLPSYHRLIHGMFGRGDGAWLTWVGRWTAEARSRRSSPIVVTVDAVESGRCCGSTSRIVGPSRTGTGRGCRVVPRSPCHHGRRGRLASRELR